MTVESELSRVNLPADGVQDTFAYPYLLLDESHMVVYEDAVITTKAYTVTGVGNPNGGTVVFSPVVPADGVTVTLSREVPYTQLTDYQPFDPFPAETHETALDKLTMLAQQNRDAEARAITGPVTDPFGLNMILPPVDDRANKYLVFQVDGSVGVATSSGSPGQINDLTDVIITNPQDNEVLTYLSGIWRNQPIVTPVGVPTGFMGCFGSGSVPAGWLACDGSVVPQATYPDLYAELGTTWGSDAGGNFTLPNIGSRVVVGVGSDGGLTPRSIADSGGAESYQLTQDNMPNNLRFGQGGQQALRGIVTGADTTVWQSPGTIQAGSSVPFNLMNPYVALPWIIKT